MIAFRDLPIQRKLMLSILLTSSVAMLVIIGLFFAFEFVGLRRTTAQQLSTLAEITAANSTAALAFENQQDAQEILGTLKALPEIEAAAIYDQAGHEFSHYPR